MKTIFEGPAVNMVPGNKCQPGKVYMIADKPVHAYLCVTFNLHGRLLVALDCDTAYPLTA